MKKLVALFVLALLSVSVFANDKVVREEFYANGNLKLQFIELEDGLVEATYFYADGTVNEKGYFKDKKLSGKWMTYNQAGELTCVGYFANNERTGDWMFYQNGEVYQVLTFSKSQIAEK